MFCRILLFFLLALFANCINADEDVLIDHPTSRELLSLRGSWPNPLTQTVDARRFAHVRWEEHPDPSVQKFFQTRNLMVSTLNESMHKKVPNHKKSWQVLEEVNGLKNEDVLIFITSTTASNEVYLWERIIPSARTWMRFYANVVVIVEDNFMIRYALRHCQIHEYAHYTTFDCHNEPRYLLSRNCTNQYYGSAGPCCKVDDAFNYLVNDNPELFKHIKYVLHGDDDTYFRPDAVFDWLSKVEKSGVSDFPIVGNSNRGHVSENKGHWHIKDGTCTEIQACGWFQPLMINHKALEMIAQPVSKYAITDTCKQFDMTHDAGLEIFFWIFSFYHIFMPHTEINPGHRGSDVFNPWQMIVHNIRHEKADACRPDNEKLWPEHLRYNQKVVLGCGDIGTPGPFHEKKKLADMYDAYEYYMHKGEDMGVGKEGQFDWFSMQVTLKDGPNNSKLIKEIIPKEETYKGTDPVETRIIPTLIQLKGYETTKHSKQHDIVHNWVPFTHQDCEIPGIIPK